MHGGSSALHNTYIYIYIYSYVYIYMNIYIFDHVQEENIDTS